MSTTLARVLAAAAVALLLTACGGGSEEDFADDQPAPTTRTPEAAPVRAGGAA